MIYGDKMLNIYRKYERLYINDRLYGLYDDLFVMNEHEAIDSTIIFPTWEELIEKYISKNTYIMTNCTRSELSKATVIYGHLWSFQQKRFKNAKVDITYTKTDNLSLKEIFENISHEKATQYLRQFIEPQKDSSKIYAIKDNITDIIPILLPTEHRRYWFEKEACENVLLRYKNFYEMNLRGTKILLHKPEDLSIIEIAYTEPSAFYSENDKIYFVNLFEILGIYR